MLEPLRRSPRKLTHFLCRELLYDFYKGHLDPDRKSAVEEYFKKHPELRAELELYSVAVKYTEKLAQTKVTSGYLIELGEVRPIGSQILHKMHWSNWPEVLKWTVEALALSAVVMVAGMFLPWERFRDLIPDPADPLPMTYEVPVAESEQVAVVEAPPTKTVTPDAGKVTQTTTPAAVSSSPTVQKTPTEPKKVTPTIGLLYSINMKMNYDAATLEFIRNKLVEYGAVKAGQVNLGWRKSNPDGSYYHFSMPEIYYRNLVQLLEQYGSVRIFKNQHPRLMPEGQIRVILWIEDTLGASGSLAPASNDHAPTDSKMENKVTKPADTIPEASTGAENENSKTPESKSSSGNE